MFFESAMSSRMGALMEDHILCSMSGVGVQHRRRDDRSNMNVVEDMT